MFFFEHLGADFRKSRHPGDLDHFFSWFLKMFGLSGACIGFCAGVLLSTSIHLEMLDPHSRIFISSIFHACVRKWKLPPAAKFLRNPTPETPWLYSDHKLVEKKRPLKKSQVQCFVPEFFRFCWIPKSWSRLKKYVDFRCLKIESFLFTWK